MYCAPSHPSGGNNPPSFIQWTWHPTVVYPGTRHNEEPTAPTVQCWVPNAQHTSMRHNGPSTSMMPTMLSHSNGHNTHQSTTAYHGDAQPTAVTPTTPPPHQTGVMPQWPPQPSEPSELPMSNAPAWEQPPTYPNRSHTHHAPPCSVGMMPHYTPYTSMGTPIAPAWGQHPTVLLSQLWWAQHPPFLHSNGHDIPLHMMFGPPNSCDAHHTPLIIKWTWYSNSASATSHPPTSATPTALAWGTTALHECNIHHALIHSSGTTPIAPHPNRCSAYHTFSHPSGQNTHGTTSSHQTSAMTMHTTCMLWWPTPPGMMPNSHWSCTTTTSTSIPTSTISWHCNMLTPSCPPLYKCVCMPILLSHLHTAQKHSHIHVNPNWCNTTTVHTMCMLWWAHTTKQVQCPMHAWHVIPYIHSHPPPSPTTLTYHCMSTWACVHMQTVMFACTHLLTCSPSPSSSLPAHPPLHIYNYNLSIYLLSYKNLN